MLGTPGISTSEAKRALDEFEHEKGRRETDQALFDALVTDLSAEGFFAFDQTTGKLNP